MQYEFSCFKDYQVGQEGIAVRPITGRTVTNAEITNFAWITADYSPDHLNRHHMAESTYGTRVAHGLLGSSLITGLFSINSPQQIGRGVPGAYFYSFEVNYRDAIRMDDTVSLNWQVAEKSDDPEHEGYGRVKTDYQLLNQDGKAVYDGTIVILVRKESAKDAKLVLKPGVPWTAKEFKAEPGKSYCIEDLPMGEGGETEGRTITEADVVNFAGLTGDWDPQYVDAEFAKKAMFGERIAHGMLVFTVSQGLWTRYHNKPLRPDTKFSGHLWDKVTFLAPVKIGDTICCHHRTSHIRISKTKPEIGLITTESQTVNQRGEVVQEAEVMHMLASREGARKATRV